MLRLKQEREARGWSRTELGYRSRVNPAKVGQIELASYRPPSGSTVTRRIADALGYRGAPEELLEEVGQVAKS